MHQPKIKSLVRFVHSANEVLKCVATHWQILDTTGYATCVAALFTSCPSYAEVTNHRNDMSNNTRTGLCICGASVEQVSRQELPHCCADKISTNMFV
jgi:hypothetical protein